VWVFSAVMPPQSAVDLRQYGVAEDLSAAALCDDPAFGIDYEDREQPIEPSEPVPNAGG